MCIGSFVTAGFNAMASAFLWHISASIYEAFELRRNEVRGMMETAERSTLIRIVGDFASKQSATISDSTCLYHDLSISGDDAWELLDRLKSDFGTSFAGLDFEAYFPQETESLGQHILKSIGFPNKRKKLTFGHLVDVVRDGHWSEPKSNPHSN
jgi:hypothetical protein